MNKGKKDLIQAVEKNLSSCLELLANLIKFPSIRGQEKEVSSFLKKEVEGYADETALMPIPESIIKDPDYSFRIENNAYNETANLRVLLHGDGSGKSLAFNTHLDVVPETPGYTNLFNPVISEGRVFGRGACDAKGQAATLWLIIKVLHDLQLRPGGDITIDFVAEEESGGNGTLFVVRNGLRADGAVVLEPTELHVVHLVRGAIWFEIKTHGQAGHSGSPASTVSALKESIRTMESIEKVREELLIVSRAAVPKIVDHPNPMPCTFGMLHSGNWPASVPSQAILKGVFGFLPPFKRKDIQEKLRDAVLAYSAEIRFNMLNSDPMFTPEGHPLVQELLRAAREDGIDSRPEFMNASADSWRYTEQLGIPTVVFGGGSITTAHSEKEQISGDEIAKAALTLILLIDRWSGLRRA